MVWKITLLEDGGPTLAQLTNGQVKVHRVKVTLAEACNKQHLANGKKVLSAHVTRREKRFRKFTH